MFQKAQCFSSRGRVGFLQFVLLLTVQREAETRVVALKGSSVSREQNNLLVRKFMTENGCFNCCPHTVFMCFVWISEQTAIISLYNIN
jgi:hypothetical protein